ncbi:MAG TPA: glycyl radical protein [Rectinemataceae bacterium]|nr:glycyl radical protein [Rectinemataceae bacterium]
MTERISRIKDDILSTPPSICIERARIYTRIYQETEALPIVRRRALALRRTLEEMTIWIGDTELIVGNHASRNRAAPIFPEYAVAWIEKEMDGLDKRPAEAYRLDESLKPELRDIVAYWKGRTLHERAEALLSPELKAIHDAAMVKAEGNMTSGDGHVAVNMYKVLALGLGGYKRLVRETDAALDVSTWEGLRRRQLYLAMLDALEGFSAYVRRFAELAYATANTAATSERRAELETIAATCAALVEGAPTSFREALQLSYFVQVVLQIESNGHSLSFGRMDQFLGPFYDRDLDSGRIKREEAAELLEATWLKLLAVKKVRSWSHTRYSAGGPLYQNVTIGGTDRAGRDAVNRLSYLILETVGELKLTQPNLSVRYHSGMTREFLDACARVIDRGFGMPAFNNDEVVIPGMLERGVSLEDAREYSAIGCIEVAVPGKWGYRTTGMSFLNMMRILLATLNDGFEPTAGRAFLPGTGTLSDFATFAELMAAWRKQVAFYTRASVEIDTAVDTALEAYVPDILCSVFTDDCIARGKHLKEGGAVYDWISGLQVGIANMGNALAAIKKLVYEDGLVSKDDLLAGLANDFAGPEGERLRLTLLNKAPKYGNDDNYVDSIVIEAYRAYIDEIAKYRNTRFGRGPIGGGYYPGTSSISANVPSGSVVKATPDGRKAGTPLAEGSSPSSGTDILGPTAVLASVGKLPAQEIFGGVLLNQKLSPGSLKTEADRQRLEAMLRTFFDDYKGWHIQYNLVSRDVLLDAKKHPEKHRDLVVRVAGYSAYFNDLNADQQDDIIARTEHELR